MHAMIPSAVADRAGLVTDLLVEHDLSAEATFPDIDPSSGGLLARIPPTCTGDVHRAVDAASDALPGWAATPSRARSEILHRAYELMLDEIEPLSLLISLEMGKTRQDARAEVRYAAEFLRWYAEEAVRVGGELSARRRDEVAARVTAAVDTGAVVHLGGTVPAGAGFFYPATVLTDVPRDATVVTQEIFGPVASIIPVEHEHDAVTVANDTELGLAAYVHSGDLARGLAVSERLEAGMVGLDRGLVSDPAAPFGGVKQSGLGREGGFEGGIFEYLALGYIAAEW